MCCRLIAQPYPRLTRTHRLQSSRERRRGQKPCVLLSIEGKNLNYNIKVGGGILKRNLHADLRPKSVMVSLYLLLSAIILTLWIASPMLSESRINPVNLYIPICLAICPSWQYIFLLFPRRLRSIVWVFPIVFSILGMIGCVLCLTTQEKSHGDFIPGGWWGGRAEQLLFLQGLLCPTLISSCISSWRIAPSFWGRIIFTVSLCLLIVLNIFIIVYSSLIRYLFIVLWLGAIIVLLYCANR